MYVNGKIWLITVHISYACLSLAAENVWNDEQSGFICNTQQLGCSNGCRDQAFPISLIRSWALEVIFVSSLSLVYMAHALYWLRVLEKERLREQARLGGELKGVEFDMPGGRRRLEQASCQLQQRKRNKAPRRGTWLSIYRMWHTFSLALLLKLDLWLESTVYGFHLQSLFKCQGYPCPNIIVLSQDQQKRQYSYLCNR